MAFHDLLVTEIFHSLQGETSLSGVPFAFIRLTGCNLRCTYCDSTYAFKGGTRYSIQQIIDKIKPFHTRHVLLTGGEPLMQRQTPELVRELKRSGFEVSIETHGEASIAPVAKDARMVMDIKTPSSGMCRMGFVENLKWLKFNDEVKFVIASPEDYSWAKEQIQKHSWPVEHLLLSPAVGAPNMPGEFSGVEPRWLAERILEDRLPVRLQIQLHKYLWGAERRGV